MRTIVEPSRETPLIPAKEIVVIGGGPGGILAALAAARTSAGSCGNGPSLIQHRRDA